MRKLPGVLVLSAVAVLGFAAAGAGQARAVSCPTTDMPESAPQQVVKDGAWSTHYVCHYGDGVHGYELTLIYYPKDTPRDLLIQARQLDAGYCTGKVVKPFRAYASSSIAYVAVGGNPKSWDDALRYATAFVGQASGVAAPCSATSATGSTATTTRAGSAGRRGCPGTQTVTTRTDKVTFAWRFSFSGVPENRALTRRSTSSGAGNGSASSFYCFYAGGDRREVRAAGGVATVRFFPKDPPSMASFSYRVSSSPVGAVKGKTVALTLKARITRTRGTSCTPGPATILLVSGSRPSVAVTVCGATLRYVNGARAHVAVSIG